MFVDSFSPSSLPPPTHNTLLAEDSAISNTETGTANGSSSSSVFNMAAAPEVFKANLSCGQLGYDEYHQIQACGFWVEGVSMSILGFIAFVTNMISIYGFTR